MNKYFEQYIEKAKRMAMTPDEKSAILSNLELTMNEKVQSPYLFSFQFTREKVLVLAVLAVFLLTTGTSLAANQSLPGDLLYPVKIGVNEKVESYIASRNGTSANFEAELAVNRLTEAEELETKGRLNPTTQAIIENNFEKHAANVKVELAASSSSDNSDQKEETSLNFQAKLETHRNILKRLSDTSDNSNSKPSLSSLIITVDNALEFNSASSSATSTFKFKKDREKLKSENSKIEGDSTTTISGPPPINPDLNAESNLNTTSISGGGNAVKKILHNVIGPH